MSKGDTLSELAEYYGVSLKELLKANPQITDPDKINIGDSIRLPSEDVGNDNKKNAQYDRREWWKLTQEKLKEVGVDIESKKVKADIKELIYGDKVSKEFTDKVKVISKDLGIDPNHLMAVIALETGETFNPSEKNRMGSGATGLIQFMPKTAREDLGTTTEKLAKMSAIKQLDYVKKHLSRHKGKMKSLDDVYMAVFYPGGIGKSRDHVLFEDPAKEYRQNIGFDKNKDKKITMEEITKTIKKYYDKGFNKK